MMRKDEDVVLVSIVDSIPACHAGDRGSIPRRGGIHAHNKAKFLEPKKMSMVVFKN